MNKQITNLQLTSFEKPQIVCFMFLFNRISRVLMSNLNVKQKKNSHQINFCIRFCCYLVVLLFFLYLERILQLKKTNALFNNPALSLSRLQQLSIVLTSLSVSLSLFLTLSLSYSLSLLHTYTHTHAHNIYTLALIPFRAS